MKRFQLSYTPYFSAFLLFASLLTPCLPASAAGLHTAWLQGDKLVTGRTSLGSARATAINWGTRSSIDPTTFEHELADPGELVVKRAGDYFVAGTLPIVSTAGDRVTQSIEFYVNGRPAPGTLGQSTYIRNASGHSESSAHVHALLTGLEPGDAIALRTRRVAVPTGSSSLETASLYAEWINEDRDAFFALARENASGTNLNIEEATDDATLQWNSERTGSSFEHSAGAGSVRLRSAGTYFVAVNIPLRGTVARASVAMEVLLDNTRVPSGLAQQGYIRNASGHQNSSLHWAGLVTTTRANQTLEISTFQRAAEGNITIQNGKDASLYIEALDTSRGVYQGGAWETEESDSWNPTDKTPILWDAGDAIIDTAVYGHSTGNTSHELTVKAAGNYLVIYNDSLEGGATRANPRITLEVNGTVQPGAQTKSHYIRNADGHTHSSGTLVYYLEDLSANDVITVSTQREGGGGDPFAEEPAQLTVIRKELFVQEAGVEIPPRVAKLTSDFRGFQMQIVESGIGVNTDSIRATVKDRGVALDISRNDNVIDVTFGFAEIPGPRSRHDVVVTYEDNQSPAQQYEIPFTIIITTPYRILPFELARLNPATNQPGFDLNISQISTFQSGVVSVHNNTIANAERQLRGEFIDPETDEPYLNEAGSINATEWELGTAIVESVINFEQEALDVGNFNFETTGHEDDFLPHIPGWNDSTDGIVAEFLMFLELSAGFHTFGVNSDDGFRFTADDPDTDERPLQLGEFDGGRGSADTLFNVAVQTPGVYPFRLLWFEGGGGANVEFFSVHEGEKILVNDRENPNAIKAYRSASGRPEPPMVEPGEITSIALTNGQIVIEFTGDLQSASSPEGPYTSVAATSSPFRVPPNQSAQFYIAR